ncbi:MAG: class I SAM-dependent methyltransferase [Candidatus Sungiibacteriota bacterium]
MNRIANLTGIVRGNFLDKDGVLYFIDVPKDVEPAGKKEPANKNLWSPWRKENYAFLKSELERLPRESLLLDIGAGQLQFRDILEDFRLVAVDFYPYPGVNVVCDINQSLPFRDASADILVMSNVLEHIAEPNILLAECARVLKPGGVMLGAVPFMINIHQRPYDFYRYTDINLQYLLKKHGFEKIDVRPVLMLSQLVFAVTSNFFVHLIQKTEYSEHKVAQAAYIFCLRVLWKIVRVIFRLLGPIFMRCANDEDLPLGYNFKAKKSA